MLAISEDLWVLNLSIIPCDLLFWFSIASSFFNSESTLEKISLELHWDVKIEHILQENRNFAKYPIFSKGNEICGKVVVLV